MRILAEIIQLPLTVLFVSCDQQHTPQMSIRSLDLNAFRVTVHYPHRGLQYECIENFAEKGITIRIMTGVDVVTLDCGLNPDGTALSTGK
jgi:hypothetical protein